MPPARPPRPAPPVPPVPPVPAPRVPPAPAPAPAAPRRRPARRFSATLFWAVVSVLTALFAANLAGYGPAIVRHEKVRVVLPPQRAAQLANQPATGRPVAPKPQVAPTLQPTPVPQPATAPSVQVPPAPTRQSVDVNININVRALQHSPAPAALVPVPTYHEGVRCDRYQGCTHFWVDPPMMPSAPAPIPPQAP